MSFYALFVFGHFWFSTGLCKSTFTTYSFVKLGLRQSVFWFFVFLFLWFLVFMF